MIHKYETPKLYIPNNKLQSSYCLEDAVNRSQRMLPKPTLSMVCHQDHLMLSTPVKLGEGSKDN